MGKTSSTSQKILLLGICNVLWGFIPLPASKLFTQYSSFTIIFSRFAMMSIIILFSVLVFVISNKLSKQNQKKAVITFKTLFDYMKSRNQDFFKLPQWAYLIIMSIFGLNMMTVLYFWGLKTIGVIITSIGVIFSLVIVTAINWGLGKEEMTKFKVLYLITLIVSAIILGIVSSSQESDDGLGFSWNALIIILSYGIAISFFVVSSSRDRMNIYEYKIIRNNHDYQIIRTFFKLGLLSLFATLTFAPMLYLFNLFPIGTEATMEISNFFLEIKNWWKLAISANGLFLILICTISPYFLYYFLAAKWPKHTSFDLWVGVMQLIEPIVNLILGVTLLKENFPIQWLIVIIFMMFLAIFMKYLSETEAQIFAIFLLKTKPENHYECMKKAYSYKPVKQIYSLIGNWDLYLDTRFHSSQSINKFIQDNLLDLPGIIKYEMQMITKIDLDRTVPDQEKGISVENRAFEKSLKKI